MQNYKKSLNSFQLGNICKIVLSLSNLRLLSLGSVPSMTDLGSAKMASTFPMSCWLISAIPVVFFLLCYLVYVESAILTYDSIFLDLRLTACHPQYYYNKQEKLRPLLSAIPAFLCPMFPGICRSMASCYRLPQHGFHDTSSPLFASSQSKPSLGTFIPIFYTWMFGLNPTLQICFA